LFLIGRFLEIFSSENGEDFLEINQLETRIVCGGNVCKRSG
jgi:hypothetical protein